MTWQFRRRSSSKATSTEDQSEQDVEASQSASEPENRSSDASDANDASDEDVDDSELKALNRNWQKKAVPSRQLPERGTRPRRSLKEDSQTPGLLHLFVS